MVPAPNPGTRESQAAGSLLLTGIYRSVEDRGVRKCDRYTRGYRYTRTHEEGAVTLSGRKIKICGPIPEGVGINAPFVSQHVLVI